MSIRIRGHMKNTTLEKIIKDAILITLISATVIVTQVLYGFLLKSFEVTAHSNAISLLVAVLITFLVYRSYDRKVMSILNKTMFRKRHLGRINIAHLNEEIIGILRDAEAGGRKTEEVCRAHNISAQTYYRWKSKYGGLDLKEARRLRALEKENSELKKLLIFDRRRISCAERDL